jgi:hypothetical protein
MSPRQRVETTVGLNEPLLQEGMADSGFSVLHERIAQRSTVILYTTQYVQ